MTYLSFKNKNLVIISVLLAFVSLFLIFVFYFFKGGEQKTLKCEDLISTNSVCIVQFNNPVDFFKQYNDNEVLKGILSDNSINEYISNIKNIDSLFSLNAELLELYENQKLIVSFNSLKSKVVPVFYLPLNNNISTKKLENTILKLNPNINLSEENYLGYDLLHNDEFGVAIIENILIYSKENEFLKNAIDNLTQKKGVNTDTLFSELYRTANNSADANIFINFESLFSKLFKYPFAYELSNSAKWGAFDYNTSENNVVFNGLVSPTFNDKSFLKLLKGDEPRVVDIARVLPVNTKFYVDFSFSNFEEFAKSFNVKNSKDSANTINTSFVGDELAFASISINDTLSCDLIAIAINSKTDCINELKKFSNFDNDNKVNSFILLPEPLSYLKIYPLDTLKYFSIIDDFLLISANSSVLKSIIEKEEENNTLDNCKLFADINKGFT